MNTEISPNGLNIWRNQFVDNHFIIIVGSRNNAQWVDSNIDSILIQDYKNYQVIYFDDASTDHTDKLVEQRVKNNSQFIVYPSVSRQYKTWFYSELTKVYPIKDNDILVFLDGDDMFYCENVLSYLNAIYNQTNCWMTYGGMVVWNGCDNIIEPFPQNSEIPPQVISQKAYRKDIWRTSHLKTMKGFLWKAFDKKDLIPNDKAMVGPDDLAIMFAMLEMCPPEKVYRVTEPLYLYNHSRENQQSRAFKDQKETGIDYEVMVRTRKPYDTLSVVSPTLAGGLGNQMFEVAAAASLAKDNNALLLLNPNEHILPNQGRNVNTYLSNVFSKIITDSDPPAKTLYQWDHAFYKQIPYQPNLKLKSHFQSYKYFDHNREYIQWLFSPTPSVQDTIINRYDIGKTGKSTAIQVRRGDYIKFPNYHHLLPPEYYTKAVKIAAPEEIWVFGDDIKWCQENLHLDCPVKYIQDEDYIELYLMTLCKNVIISNSSFGWWAAYLNRRENHQIFAPSPWFGPAIINDGFKMDDLVLNTWNIVT